MYGIELVIVICGTFCCALAAPSPTISAVGLLAFWRIFIVRPPHRRKSDGLCF